MKAEPKLRGKSGQNVRRLVLLCAFVIAVVAGWRWLGSPNGPTTQHVGRPLIEGEFSLVDHNGNRVTKDSYKGRWLLVFFGFTHCPDVCPTTLNTVAIIMKALGDEAKNIQPLFITVDPERDTPKVLGEYVAAFDAPIVGLTGAPERIKAAARSFKAFYARAGQKDAPGGYSVNHSAFLYLMDTAGKYRTHFSHRTPPDKIAAAIRRYLRD